MKFLVGHSQNQILLKAEYIHYALTFGSYNEEHKHATIEWIERQRFTETFHPRNVEEIPDDLLQEMNTVVDLRCLRWYPKNLPAFIS